MDERARKLKLEANEMYANAQGPSPPPRPIGTTAAALALQKAWDKGTEDKKTGKVELPYPDVKGAMAVPVPPAESRKAKLVPIAPEGGRKRGKSSRVKKTKKTGRRRQTRRR